MGDNNTPRHCMDEYFDAICGGTELNPTDLQILQHEGFVVIPGPSPVSTIADLAASYDLAISQADPTEVASGGQTTRVHDFVNRGSAFDEFYVYPPVLTAARVIIGQPFKLSSFLARTLNTHPPAQRLHVDFQADDHGWPMLGFILMIDEFQPDNGATYFCPGSQGAKPPSEKCANHPLESDSDVVQACGPAGSMVVYNGSIWHGHAANMSDSPRRSIQGTYIRRSEKSHYDFKAGMRPETLSRISLLAKYLLAL